MEFLEYMPATVRSEIRGVIFDIDDTVTREGCLERCAFDAMWRLADAHVRLVAVTGRPLGWCDVLARHWPVDLAVGENGAGWVWRQGRATRRGYFHDEHERARQAEIRARVQRRVAEAFPDIPVVDDQGARRCDLAFDVGEEQEITPARARRLVEFIAQQGVRATSSTVHVHAIPGAWDKASGVTRALEQVHGMSPGGDWVFVGDSGNDASAFEAFPVTVGVRNVEQHLDELPVPPRWITYADRGAGFAELARALLD